MASAGIRPSRFNRWKRASKVNQNLHLAGFLIALAAWSLSVPFRLHALPVDRHSIFRVAEFDLYIDCDSAAVVTSSTNNTRKALPRIVYGDTLLLRIRLLKGFSYGSAYELIPTDGITLQVRLLDGILTDSSPVADVLAFQGTWTDYDGEYFEAELALNTSAIQTALGSENSFNATFEVKYTRGGLPSTVLQQAIQVWRASDPNSVVPAATPTPLSAEDAAATYVRANTHWGPIYIGDPDNPTAPLIKIWNDNGNFRSDQA